MNYINEHTWVGQAGHLLIITAFVSALAGAVSYFADSRQQSNPAHSGKLFSRIVFGIHSLSVVLAVLLLFFAIGSHYFEYHYVWKYSNLAMQTRYIFSCFWSGQEGSLLLWIFWIVVLSWFVLRAGWKWETRVMPLISLTLAFLCSMLLGVYFGEVKIGSDPFILIRELPENAGMPWARMDDYLLQITSFQDGVGLNPLLQNYWMTIHPPVLFLGFAATLFPFAFAIAGALYKDEFEWTKMAASWGVFGMAVLGCGILLGGAWAYESLSFGGFWAWDPVENASLVPWLLLVAAVHCLQITIRRQRGVYLSLLFSVAPFLLVLYSSYLTRSGVLGESSVHAFTENGLAAQLLIFLFVGIAAAVVAILRTRLLRIVFISSMLILFGVYSMTDSLAYTLTPGIAISIALLLINYEKHFHVSRESLRYSSRELWVFAGAMLFLISAFQITISTSIPVINRIFGSNLDAFTDLGSRNQFYHTWQIPLAIIITALIGISQFLNYRHTDASIVKRRTFFPLFVALGLAALLLIFFRVSPIGEWPIFLLVISCMIAIAFNAQYLRKVLSPRYANAGSAMAHIGFALLILGALISGARRDVISENGASFSLEELNKDFRNNENILLKQGDTVMMGNYFVSYRGKRREGPNLVFQVNYYEPEMESATGQLSAGDSIFSLHPIVQLNEQFGNVSEPGTKHFFSHDVFTHVKYADMEVYDVPEDELNDGFMKETVFTLGSQTPVKLENYEFRLQDIYLIDKPAQKQTLGYEKDDILVRAVLRVRNTDLTDTSAIVVAPVFAVRDSSQVLASHEYSSLLDARVRIAGLGQEPNTIMLGVSQREFIVMQASVFPAMNVLWTGCVLMVLGCLVSLRKYVSGRDSSLKEKTPVIEEEELLKA